MPNTTNKEPFYQRFYNYVQSLYNKIVGNNAPSISHYDTLYNDDGTLKERVKVALVNSNILSYHDLYDNEDFSEFKEFVDTIVNEDSIDFETANQNGSVKFQKDGLIFSANTFSKIGFSEDSMKVADIESNTNE